MAHASGVIHGDLKPANVSAPMQLTHGPGVWQGNPRFSPDGRHVAFSSRGEDGFSHLWTIDADGGPLRRLTQGPFHEGYGVSWSRDGRWIYFREDRADGRDIARIPAAGGRPVRLTRHGGVLARESPDGRSLFYTEREGGSPLLRLVLPDGPERRVVDCVYSPSLDAGRDGIYYAGCVPDGTPVPLYLLDPATGHSRLLGHMRSERSSIQGIAASPDGKTVLFASLVSGDSDLFLIENFR